MTQKGDIIPEEVAGSDWEPWSEPYEVASGSPITSPSPRKYLKVRARLLSDDPDAFATLGCGARQLSRNPVGGKPGRGR